jgi:hypothetical protein
MSCAETYLLRPGIRIKHMQRVIIWAALLVLGVIATLAVVRAITRAIYYGTAPPLATDLTHESTNISGDRGDDGANGVPVAPPATHDRRDLPRIATFR